MSKLATILLFALLGLSINIYDNFYSVRSHQLKSLREEKRKQLFELVAPIGDVKHHSINKLNTEFSNDPCYKLIKMKIEFNTDIEKVVESSNYSIVYLYNECKNEMVDTIAFHQLNSAGERTITSRAENNKIYKTTISKYPLKNKKRYHLTLMDSIAEVWFLDYTGQKLMITKDSVRTSIRYSH